MSLGEIRLQLQRLAAGDLRLPQVELARVPVRVEYRAGVGHSRVRKRIFRIDLDRAIEHLPGVFYALAPPLMDVLPAAEIIVVRLDIDRSRLFDRLLLAFGEDHTQGLDDRLCDVVLNRKHILQLAVVPFRPEVVSVGDVHELRRNTQLVPHLPDTSLEDGRDLELSADVSDVLVFSLERERRSAGRHAQ